METPRRSFRIADDRYSKAQKAAETLGTDLTSAVNEAFDKLIAKAAKREKESAPAGA